MFDTIECDVQAHLVLVALQPASPSAAHGHFPVPRKFHEIEPGYQTQQFARFIVLLHVPSQVTGIVVGNTLVRFAQGDPSLLDKVQNEIYGMVDLIVPPIQYFWIEVLQGTETACTGSDDFFRGDGVDPGASLFLVGG